MSGLWSTHDAAWRNPAQICSQWEEAAGTDPTLLRWTAQGLWWDILADLDVTLLVTREYEHLAIAMNVCGGRPSVSFLPVPHPSGLAVDRTRGIVHLASTRNPNQIHDLAPVTGIMPRLDAPAASLGERPLIPVRSCLYPGCLYLHDLAMVGGTLHANSVGQNAVVRLDDHGGAERVWWPRCIETEDGPRFGQNHIQLNSIAAGADLQSSYFSASSDRLSARRPGHQNFPVDRRGVVFSGATREPMLTGLTRPHSARLHRGRVWVDNSGYGELGFEESGAFVPTVRLPGWTRGLCFYRDVAFVGTSRIIPRFTHYAPGLNVDTSVCGVHAVDTLSGRVLGSLLWPNGNQVFAVEWVPRELTSGFPFPAGKRRSDASRKGLFYAFQVSTGTEAQ